MSDFISRQAAIDVLTHFTNLSWDKLKIMYPMLTMIEELPSAERHGRWLHLHLDPDNITGHTKGECSICGKLRIVDNYCPNCGAKMDEVERNEN